MDNQTKAKLVTLVHITEALKNKHKYRALDFVFPLTGKYSRNSYPKAMEFYAAGATHRFRCLAGANGVGKSFDGAVEWVYHATGEYPEWWVGRRLKNPKLLWIVSESPDTFKSSLQKLLLGGSLNEEDLGTGLIPKERLHNTHAWGGASGAVRAIEVRHINGHIVTIEVKSFEQESSKLQASTIDGVLFDEEPPIHVHTECVMRTRGSPTKPPGIGILLFTSLKGLTETVMLYAPNGVWPEGECKHDPDKYVVRIEMDDVPHLTEEDKRMYIANSPPHQLESRTKGLIQMGSGKIYPFPESQVIVPRVNIPDYWPRAYALDFGHHCTCALWGAKDPHTNVLYIYDEYYIERHETAQIHALNIKARGAWMKGIADPSGGGRQDDGKQLIEIFRNNGLDLTKGDNAFIPGITRNSNMFQNGTLKITENCTNTLTEFRLYRFDTKTPNEPARGQKDHAMDTLKYLTSKFDRVAISKSSIDHPEDSSDFRRNNKRRKVDESGY